jgi:hypothetical protein
MDIQVVSVQVEVFFLVGLLFSIFYILFLLVTLYVPVTTLLQRVFAHKTDKHKIAGRIIFADTALTHPIKLEARELSSNKKFVFFSRPGGVFTLFLPDGEFEIHVRQFGLKQLAKIDFVLNDTECPTRLDIKVKQTEQLIINPLPSRFISYAKFVWLFLGLAGFILYFLNIEYLEITQSLVILILSSAGAYMAAQSEKMFFKLMDFTNKPLRGKKIVIKNSHDQALADLSTSASGKLKVFASRGIYKIETDAHLQRTFRVNKNSIIDLKLKL